MSWFNRWLWPSDDVGEDRALSGSESYFNDVSIGLAGGSSSPQATAAVEFGLGMIWRAFLRAEPTAPIPGVDSAMLAFMAVHAVGSGNTVLRIEVNRRTGRFSLIPASNFEVVGDVSPSSWVYRLEHQRPTGEPAKQDTLGAGVVHIRYKPSPIAPWMGISPLARAGLTSTQLANIERSLGFDAKIKTGGILPFPHGLPEGRVAKKLWPADLAAGEGFLNVTELAAESEFGGAGAVSRGP